MLNKKGDLSLNIIIVTVILLVVLVVVLMIFTGRMNIFTKGLGEKTGDSTKSCGDNNGVFSYELTCPTGFTTITYDRSKAGQDTQGNNYQAGALCCVPI